MKDEENSVSCAFHRLVYQVGRGTTMADKCSIKRSVLGAMCKLGSNVKIINSVLMDGVEVETGCHLQNCIICPNAHLQV